MQRRIARLFLLIFLMQVTPLGEFARLPLLVQHYMQHKHLHPETTIYGFFKMHYLDKTVVDSDYDQDMQLPFKTVHAHFAVQMSMPQASLTLSNVFFPLIKEDITNLQFILPNSSLSSIFKPPIMAS
ncbi:hypothetical protein ACPPVU_04050 [Mucilaginibacter sp. McL0603]|uniref:hypothetical protein n=1 Tax=Mucilaginibacter sp. McL0603 TaxID=3415670 RepID=UPI003CE78906